MFPAAHDWLARCESCGLGQASPQPTDAELAEIYSAEYYSQFGYQSGAEAGLARIKQATYARMLARAERLIPPLPLGEGRGEGAPGDDTAGTAERGGRSRPPSPGLKATLSQRERGTGRPRLLDVGCGLGYSLLAGQRRGWDAWGIEPHEKAGAGLPAELAGRIVRGTLEDFRPDAPFGLVSLIDVIEHVRDPVATIRQAAALLGPGGLLMLATNDVTSRSARRLGPRWVHFHRAHLWYFSQSTLARAAEAAGLTVRRSSPAWRVYNLQYVASILAAGANFPLARAMARLSLRLIPRRLRLLSWPPLPEGIVLFAQRP